MTKRIPLRPKREPSQARSRDTVQRILDAALRVLKANGVEGFTNNHVAAEAGLSIASVYQFFPNKQAIIYRLYQDWLREVTDRLTHEVEQGRPEPDWRLFAGRLSDVLAEAAVDRHAESELLRAMWSHRELIDLDREHSRALGVVVAGAMRRYGAALPGAELAELASFANELHTLVAERAMHGTDRDKRRLDQFARIAYLALWGHALGESVTAPPPPSDAAGRSPTPSARGVTHTGRRGRSAKRRSA